MDPLPAGGCVCARAGGEGHAPVVAVLVGARQTVVAVLAASAKCDRVSEGFSPITESSASALVDTLRAKAETCAREGLLAPHASALTETIRSPTLSRRPAENFHAARSRVRQHPFLSSPERRHT
jgi:hypothetical protein